MRPHRRVGNVVLTAGLSFVARRRITDGQSGYRAFSPAAAAAAEIVHDYNYAQVLTLDLLAKGFRYHEVPISYHFRTTGRSFVTLGRYLRNVVPAVYRELNTVMTARSAPPSNHHKETKMRTRRTVAAIALAALLVGAPPACGDDDGADVRDLGDGTGASASGSGSGSGSGPGRRPGRLRARARRPASPPAASPSRPTTR